MTLRILFVGLGGVGQRHLRNLRSLLGEELDPIAYRVRRENAVLTDQLTIAQSSHLEREFRLRVFDDLDRALGERPEICIVANPSALHVPVALRAAEAKVDLFIEKPLSADMHSVRELIDEVRRNGSIGYVAYQLRFHPGVQGLIRALDERRCGRIYSVHCEVSEYLPAFHPYEDYRRMYASRKDLGGGVVLTQIHEVDLLYRLFGLPQSVYSVGGKLSDLEVDVEDCVTSIFKYRHDDGGCWAATLHQDYLGRPPRRRLIVHGALGTLELDLRQGYLDFISHDGESHRLVDAKDFPRNELFLAEMRHFLETRKNGARPVVTLEDGAASLSMALGIKASLSTGGSVNLASIGQAS